MKKTKEKKQKVNSLLTIAFWKEAPTVKAVKYHRNYGHLSVLVRSRQYKQLQMAIESTHVPPTENWICLPFLELALVLLSTARDLLLYFTYTVPTKEACGCRDVVRGPRDRLI